MTLGQFVAQNTKRISSVATASRLNAMSAPFVAIGIPLRRRAPKYDSIARNKFRVDPRHTENSTQSHDHLQGSRAVNADSRKAVRDGVQRRGKDNQPSRRLLRSGRRSLRRAALSAPNWQEPPSQAAARPAGSIGPSGTVHRQPPRRSSEDYPRCCRRESSRRRAGGRVRTGSAAPA